MKFGKLEQDADRADQRGAGHDVVGGHGGDVAARAPRPSTTTTSGFFAFEADERVVKLLGAGGRAPGAVDMTTTALRLVLAEPLSAATRCGRRGSDRRSDPRDVIAGAAEPRGRATAKEDAANHGDARRWPTTRQNISLRRIRRRSTMPSASSGH